MYLIWLGKDDMDYYNKGKNTNLSAREKECLSWAMRDKTVKETSELMNLSPDTVKMHRARLLRKMSCHTIAGAVTIAIRSRCIDLNLDNMNMVSVSVRP